MRSAPAKPRRAMQPYSAAGLRPIAVIVLSAPFLLSACVSGENSMKSSALAQKPAAAAGAPDAYGYAPVRITAFADGSRVAQPSAKPDAAKLAAAASATPPSGKTARVTATAPAGAEPQTEIAALQADVAERKAVIVATMPSAVPAVVPVPDSERADKTSRLSAAATALNPAEAVPATIAAVADTAGAVVDTADAVKVAAVETTAKAYNAVSERFGDTFKGKDTITGDAAIDRMIERSAAENGIPSELAYAVVRVESHYNPKAKGSGVYGLSQIQPATARSLGFSGTTTDLYDPETNLRYGMKYLAGAWEKSGHDICGAAMKYKGGHRTTRMSKSAAVYCANVKRHMAAIERRRAPANQETIVAANEREKQIAVATTPAQQRAKASIFASRSKTAPQPPTGESQPTPVVASTATAAPVAEAAASPSGRMVAESALPVPSERPATLAAPLAAAADKGSRGGRVIRTSQPVAASAAPTGLGLAD